MNTNNKLPITKSRNIKNAFFIREAENSDIPILARHHRLMFEEIWNSKGEIIDPAKFHEMEKGYKRKLQDQLASGLCRAWLIEDKGKIIASGAISVIETVPVPDDPSCQIAYLHSIYTEKKYRNQKLASRIIGEAIIYCNSTGIKRMTLNYSNAARSLYKLLGFQPADDAMRLWL